MVDLELTNEFRAVANGTPPNQDLDDSYTMAASVVEKEGSAAVNALMVEMELLAKKRAEIKDTTRQRMEKDPLELWTEHRLLFPKLYRIAAIVLSIPLGTVEVERLFSYARPRYDYNQAMMLATTFEQRLMDAYNFWIFSKRLIEHAKSS